MLEMYWIGWARKDLGGFRGQSILSQVWGQSEEVPLSKMLQRDFRISWDDHGVRAFSNLQAVH